MPPKHVQMLASGRQKDLLSSVYQAYTKYEAEHDLVVLNGWQGGSSSFNAQVAAYLDAPALLVLGYRPDETPSEAFEKTVSDFAELF